MELADESLLQQNIARAFEEQRFEDAVKLLEPLAWSHNDSEMFNNLGALFFQLQWLREAEAAFRRALRIEPGHATASTNLADQFLHQGLPYSAMQVLKNAATAGVPESVWQPVLEQLQAQFPVQRVSVYTPGYASEDYIERCIKSILAQSYPVHEIIVVDDRSPDRSTEIALRYGVKVFYHDENLGLAASCNTALRHCTGDFLAKIDTDLELDPTWLERAMLQFRDPTVAGVGGRLLEHRTTTVPDQWRRLCMEQHWGRAKVINPRGLFGADCVFRVRALRSVDGWNARYRTNFEDFDLSARLKRAGFTLIYEPLACARHLRQDRLDDVVRNCWNWQHAVRQDNGWYDGIPNARQALAANRTATMNTLNGLMNFHRFELLYPSFLIYFWWSIRDLQQVVRRNGCTLEAASETALGAVIIARHQLRTHYGIPAWLVERTLEDVRRYLRSWIAPPQRELLEADSALERIGPSSLKTLESLCEAVVEALPAADPAYLEDFARGLFLEAMGPGVGSLIELSARTLEREEREQEGESQTRLCYVLFNPPARRGFSQPGLNDGAAAMRWPSRMRIERFADQLKARGARVLIVDAVELHLDEREALERVLGAEPAGVVFDASQGELDRLIGAARLLKLWGTEELRTILIGAGPRAEQPARRQLPMFDEVYEGLELSPS